MPSTLYKLDIQGIVYLVDPTTSDVYVYDVTNLTKIGHVIWKNSKERPELVLLSNWQEILKQKCDDAQPTSKLAV
jgi:hypothetical protein